MKLPCALLTLAAVPTAAFAPKAPLVKRPTGLNAAPKRFSDNADGVVFVNEKCINCGACANFAPDNFQLADGHHVVYKQPSTEPEIDASRAALAACPVAAIRLETSENKELASRMSLRQDGGKEKPFPRLLSDGVWFLGHHNKDSFGAMPYLAQAGGDKWIMVDTPKFSKSSVEAVTSLTGPDGPDYLLLTHVDDTADHNKWRQEFPSVRRIFHTGDLGIHNWLEDETLEDVEILLTNDNSASGDSDALQLFDLEGNPLESMDGEQHDAVILHTPGHSPGSISLYLPNHKTIFTGDTLGYTQRTNTLTGFPRYGNNLQEQVHTVEKLSELGWTVVAPGHGHARKYDQAELDTRRQEELHEAVTELKRW